MFGLMKARTCSAPPEVKLRRRMHYCGTCKTIGRLYGQKARFLLNNDTVFLAELLSALSGDDQELGGWAAQYRSYNCLSLPSAPEEMPVALQLAAAATMVMAEFKIADHMADHQGRGLKLASGVFRDSFGRAAMALQGWGFPLDELRDCWSGQIERERTPTLSCETNWDDQLRYFAEPTAWATGLFFEQGARIACGGRAADQMRTAGRRFGELVYLLDALEDYEKDARSGDFNPLRVAFPTAGDRLESEAREKTIALLREIGLEIESGLARLPIPHDRAHLFAARLRANLSSRIGVKLPVIGQPGQTCKHSPSARMSFTDRMREAVMLGRGLTKRHLEDECQSLAARILAPFVFTYTAALALVFPQDMRTLASARESFGMPFNLILVGGLVRSWPRIMLKSEPPSGPSVTIGPPEQGTAADATEEARRHAEEAAGSSKKGGCGGCCCDADCGDCCDCCDCCSGCDC